MDFKVGDTVTLKSGGEAMTVEEVSDDLIDCVWFNNKKVERGSFTPVTLKKIENDFSEF